MQVRVVLVAVVVASVLAPAAGVAGGTPAPGANATAAAVEPGELATVDAAAARVATNDPNDPNDPNGGAASTAPIAADTGGPTAGQLFSDSETETEPPPDPDGDAIGWEAGYWHNESIDVDQSDGLSDAELDAFVARSMARVEYVREREFEREVPVSVITREEYRAQSNNSTGNASFERWNDQVWEALFVVGEDADSAEALSDTYGSSVAGFYSPTADEIRIVTDSPDSPVIDNATLVHELVHALQDQYVDLGADRYVGRTQDAQLATDGVVEGEANYVETEYARRCATGEWDCVATPATGGGSGNGPGPNLGVLVTVLQPYSDGPVYVDHLLAEGGWDAYEPRFRHPPNSTEQVIHRTDEEPVPLSVEHNATGNWTTFPGQGVNGSETVGEASMYAMFWYQTRTAGADAVDLSEFTADGRYDMYNYDAEPSEGWGNDQLVPYRRGEGDDAEYGYVWTTEWDSRADAREFVDGYESILDAQDADSLGDGRYEIDSGPFADSFRVVRNGTRVTIVNGPTSTAVDQLTPNLTDGTATVNPNADPDDEPDTDPDVEPDTEPDDGDGTPTPTPTVGGPDPDVDDDPVTPVTEPEPSGTPTDARSEPASTAATTPTEADGSVTTDGFGAVVALLALVAVAFLLGRR